MKRRPVAEEDRRSIADWIGHWGDLVAEVNFKASRPLFAEDAVAFGSKVEMMTSQAQLEAEQWRAIWPSIEDYLYDLSTLELDRVAGPADGGRHGDLPLHRPARRRQEIRAQRPRHRHLIRDTVSAPWICTHSHVSLKPGTPSPSHGKRPEKN